MTSCTVAGGQQEGLIGVLHELMEAEDGIVRLHHRVGDLGRRDHREGLHDAVRVPWICCATALNPAFANLKTREVGIRQRDRSATMHHVLHG